ncbi:NACHT domain-containing protein [Micromonospora sp. NPDC049903]|uniref:NACHT domain-containing protein n=1 Tax=Micromonospora sp. NPDC049903 TaxID=3364276 RepID=UPI0037AAA6DD
MRSTTLAGSDTSESLLGLVRTGEERRIVLLGNPGAGKTTLAKQLCLDLVESSPDRLPVFAELKRYQATTRDIRTLLRAQAPDLWPRDEKELPGRVGVVVLDGLNEVAESQLHDALADIEDFIDSPDVADVTCVLTCRAVDFPTSYGPSFARYEVVPVSAASAQRYLDERLGPKRAEQVWRQLPHRLRTLCHSPLLLGMLTTVLLDEADTDRDLPRNRGAVYARFLSQLNRRTRERNRVETPEDIREACLAFLAYRLKNERVDVPRIELGEYVTKDFFDPSWHIPIGALQREVLDLPPMGAVSSSQPDAASHRSFMHQSFQEYYTAVYLKSWLSRPPQEGIRLADLRTELGAGAVAWRETFCFLSGMLDDSTELVRACRKAENHLLAAGCIEHANTVLPAEVDDFICQTLDAFKYGDAFNYHLMFALQRVTDRSSSGLPRRVVDDIGYWAEKYSRSRSDPQTIATSVTDGQVIAMVTDGSPHERIDAVWTLGQRQVGSALPMLEALAVRETDEAVREYAVVALGRIAAERSFPILRQIATSNDESKWIRSYALHAIGSFPTPEAVAVLVDYLTQPDRQPFADDAAWPLSVLARSHHELVRPQLPVLLEVLHREALDRYTKGCVLYVFGCGGFTEANDAILDYLKTEEDPYVLEDGAHALGALGLRTSIGLLSRLADPAVSGDAMTRREALRSLVALDGVESPAARAARQDPASFVRDVVERHDR